MTQKKELDLLQLKGCQPPSLSRQANVCRIFIEKIASLKPNEERLEGSTLFSQPDQRTAIAIANVRKILKKSGILGGRKSIISPEGAGKAIEILKMVPQIEAQRWLDDFRRLPDEIRENIGLVFKAQYPEVQTSAEDPIDFSHLDKKDEIYQLATNISKPIRIKTFIALIYLLQTIADSAKYIPSRSTIEKEAGVWSVHASEAIDILVKNTFIRRKGGNQPCIILNDSCTRAQTILAPFYDFEQERLMAGLEEASQEMRSWIKRGLIFEG